MNIPHNGFIDFEIRREPYEDFVELWLPIGDGQSYLFTVDELENLKSWMKQVGADETMIDKILDVAWNFGKAKYNLVEQRVVAL